MDDRLLGGRYELRSRIGIGGMAKVYRALDRQLGREVAVKVLDPELAADPAFVERFQREARAAAALSHPNIVRLYDLAAVDDTYYLVMEYIAGSNLKEVLRQRGPLPELEALDLAAHIAGALEAAHQQGIVHRDVKPHNVLLDENGQARVADFGLARPASAEQLTPGPVVLGTPRYMSPEQAQGQPADGRSDLYSLGVVLYELLTGQVPFTGETAVAVSLQHVRDEPRRPSLARPAISPLTDTLVLKALAKDPAQRYQRAEDMRAALEQLRRQLVAESLAPTHRIRPVAPIEVQETVPMALARDAEPAPTSRRRRRSPRAAAGLWVVGVGLALFPLLVGAGLLAVAPPAPLDLTAALAELTSTAARSTRAETPATAVALAARAATIVPPATQTSAATRVSMTPTPASKAAASPNCPPGQAPVFALAFQGLSERLGAGMGTPLECAHKDVTTNDVQQKTTTGLAYLRGVSQTPTFTNGSEHWALTEQGLAHWTGQSADPPPSTSLAPAASPTPLANPTARANPIPSVAPTTSGNPRPSVAACQSPSFALSLQALKGRLGATMGEPLECEHGDGATSDVQQRTTTGLAYYRGATGTPTFTDGFEHWALTDQGLVHWSGDSPDPPPQPRPAPRR